MCDICELNPRDEAEWNMRVEILADAADKLSAFCSKKDIAFIEQYPFQHSLNEMGGWIRYMTTRLNHADNPNFPDYNDMVVNPDKPTQLIATVSKNLQSRTDYYIIRTTAGVELNVVRFRKGDFNTQRAWIVYATSEGE